MDSRGRTIFVADAHGSDGQRFIVRADEKLTAFLDLRFASSKNDAALRLTYSNSRHQHPAHIIGGAAIKIFPRFAVALFSAILATSASAARHADGPLTPFRSTTKQGAYTIDTVGDTLGQALPQNTRLIIRIFGANNKVVKPGQIALVDKSGAVIKPVFREDRKVGHEENTGLPLTLSPQASTSGYSGTGVGINLNKIFGPHGSYSYTKVDWSKAIFTADKRLQIALLDGQTLLLPLTSLAK